MPLTNAHVGRYYHLLRQIGNAGTGTLYLAQDTHVPRQVAVKVVPLDDTLQRNSAAAQRIEKLFHEAMQAIAQLNHPAILPVFDFGQSEIEKSLDFYVVTEYCPAGSLADWLSQAPETNAGLLFSGIAHFLSQAAIALHYAHQHGVIHQDVKPSNFLAHTPSSRPDHSEAFPDFRLADFGMAHFFAALSSQGLSQSPYIRGTSLFLAPEQWDGQTVPASDQYALAILAFRLLTGQFPFQGSLGQLIHQHHTAQPPAPSSLNPHLDTSIDTWIKRALAKHPAQRFPSMLDFAQAFANIQRLPDDQQHFGSLTGSRPSPDQTPAVLPERKPALSALPAPGEEPAHPEVPAIASTQPTQVFLDATNSSAPVPIDDLAAEGLTFAPPMPIKSAPSLPARPPVPSIKRTTIQRRKASALQKSLLIALLALAILVGSDTLLFRSTTNAVIPQRGSSTKPGQTTVDSSGVTITITPTMPDQTPTVPGSTSTPTVGSTLSSTTRPTAGTTLQPTATPVPPGPTPTPTPHPCLIHNWTLILTPTYAKGGHALYVSPYCDGVVYLTLTQRPASGGHSVSFQICFALNSTNCTGWVAYTSPYAWRVMATGLRKGQVFYINGLCSKCTSDFTMYGSAKY